MIVSFAEPKMSTKTSTALKLTVLAECSTTRARTSLMELPHATVETPVFMPVGTQGKCFDLRPDFFNPIISLKYLYSFSFTFFHLLFS